MMEVFKWMNFAEFMKSMIFLLRNLFIKKNIKKPKKKI